VLSKRRVRCIKGKEIVLTEGNYVGTSHGMEGEGFRWCVDWLDKKKIKRLACDRDSSVGHTLAIDPRLKHIKVCFDRKMNWAVDHDIYQKCRSLHTASMSIPIVELSLVVANCQGRLRHIKTHYFEPECSTKCPCYTLEHPINLLRLCPPASYFPLISTLFDHQS